MASASTGSTRTLRRLAAAVATSDYGIAEPSPRIAASRSFNTLFRIAAVDRRLVLRVGNACRIHVPGVEDVEAAWLQALADTSTVIAPEPVPTTSGRFWVERALDGVPGTRTCSMFTFVEGRPLWPRVSATEMVAAGRLLAQLHEHAASRPHATAFPTGLSADAVLYLPHDNRLADHPSPHRPLFAEAIDWIQQRLDALWASPPHRPHLLHGDFTPRNILTWRSHLRPVDFQDLQYGFDLQDLGVTLADLGRMAPALIDPFIVGYRQVRAWPELEPEYRSALTAARSLNLVNLGLHLHRPGLGPFIADHATRIARALRSGTGPAG